MPDEKDTAAQDSATGQDDNEHSEETAESALDDAARKARDKREEKVPHTLVEVRPQPKATQHIVVEISADEWQRRVDEMFKDLQHDASIEGFRKGKAPLRLLQRRYMKEVTEDIVDKVTPAIAREYSEEKKVAVYGTPKAIEQKIEPGQPVRLTIEIEVKPEIDPQGYAGQEIEVPKFVLTEAMARSRMEDLQRNNADYVEIDKGLEAEDAAVLDVKVLDARGQTLKQQTNEMVERALGSFPKPVSEALKGKKAGETVEIKVPSTVKGIAGPVAYTVALKSVKSLKLPEIDDDFAKDVGYENLAAMRASIDAENQRMVDGLNRDEALDILLKKIVSMHDFEVPTTLQQEIKLDLLESDYRFMYQTGMRPSRMRDRSKDEYRDELDRTAAERVKAILLMDAIGKKEGIETTEADIESALETEAQKQGRKSLAVRAALEKNREWDNFLERLRYNKIQEFLLSKTKVKYVERTPEKANEGSEA